MGGVARVCVLVAFATGAIGAAAPAGPPPAEEWARRIETRHRAASDMTARFVQTYRSKMLSRQIVERGSLAIKRPGRMRWEYTSPEKKLFVSDGRQVFFYVPADKQVIRQEQSGDKGVALSLLSGQADLLGEFHAVIEPDASGRPRLRLTPRKPDPQVERVFLETDAQNRISVIDVKDTQGNESRFVFEDIRENTGVKDDKFRFVVPRGVEVISG